jgi:acetyl/propionyl-CoA carboxylase alpha subunit
VLSGGNDELLAIQVEQALEEVLEQGIPSALHYASFLARTHTFTDEDLTAMYLTDKKNNLTRDIQDHQDLEVLLETFSKQVEEIVNEAQNMEVRSCTRFVGLTCHVQYCSRVMYSPPKKSWN